MQISWDETDLFAVHLHCLVLEEEQLLRKKITWQEVAEANHSGANLSDVFILSE